MDALVFMILALVMTIMELRKPDTIESEADGIIELQKDNGKRVAKLNESFYRDDDAFSEIIHALGFPKGE